MTTEIDRTARLQALQARRSSGSRPKRGRPAEASRILAAGAGTAAMLSLVTLMATADAAAAPPVTAEPASFANGQAAVTNAPPSQIVAAADRAVVSAVAPVQTVTVVRVARPQAAQSGRTNGSR